MQYEKSCGAVVYTIADHEIRYVLVESLEGFHGFPKGHTDPGETEEETALQEIFEETGLHVSIKEGFRTVDEHPIPQKPGVIKQIVYFLAGYEDQTIRYQASELLSAKLYSFDEAMRIFEFESSRRILREANDFLIRVHVMTAGHPLWDSAAAYAEACSWRAGPHLAERMKAHAFKDLERVFCVTVDGEIAGFCTFSETDELPPSYGFSPFIGFVFVGEAYRGKRLSGKMIDAATEYAGNAGFKNVYVMSGESGLYEKYGFRKLGDYPTIYGTIDQLFVKQTGA